MVLNFQCPSVLLIWIRVGQGSPALAVGGLFWTFFLFSSCLPSLFSFSLSLKTARYRLKYYLKGALTPKQPINHYDGASNEQSMLAFLKWNSLQERKLQRTSLMFCIIVHDLVAIQATRYLIPLEYPGSTTFVFSSHSLQ